VKRQHNVQDKILAEIEELEFEIYDREAELKAHESDFEKQNVIWEKIEKD